METETDSDRARDRDRTRDRGTETESSLASFLIRALIPSDQGPTGMTSSTTLGVRASAYEFWGDTGIQSLATILTDLGTFAHFLADSLCLSLQVVGGLNEIM